LRGVWYMADDDRRSELVEAVLGIIVEGVEVAGDHGAPGGTLYAALMTVGCSLEQFEVLMGILIARGRVTKRGELYFMGASRG
jgi:hypothetical protein